VREFCWTCRKAQVTCYCKRVKPCLPDITFALLVHPRESRNSVATGRMLHLGLGNSVWILGAEFQNDPQVLELLADPGNFCVILYPGPGALDLTNCAPETARAFFPVAPPAPEGRRLVVFIVDGTWDLARGMLNRSPILLGLPQIRFTPSTPSIYQIRKQPEAHCFSTLEAAHWLIDRLDELGVRAAPAGRAHDELTRCFASMIVEQVAYAANDRPRFLSRQPGVQTQYPATTASAPEIK
jgi:DTW domain-containing protein YfiP